MADSVYEMYRDLGGPDWLEKTIIEAHKKMRETVASTRAPEEYDFG